MAQVLATIYSPDLVAAQQELLTASRMRESQPALYKAVRNKLKYGNFHDTQIDSIEASGEVKGKPSRLCHCFRNGD